MNKNTAENTLKFYDWNGFNTPIQNFPLIMENDKMTIKWNSNRSGIYVWLNKINGKMYIGRANNLYRRVYDEKRAFKNGRHENLKKLFNAVAKYGIQNFTVYELIISQKINLIKLEECLISYFNTKNNGYNCTYGGEGTIGHIVTETQIKKQKERMKSYWTDEKRKSHSEKMKIWANNPIRKNHLINVGKSWLNDINLVEKQRTNTIKSLTTERINSQKQSLKKYYKTHIHPRCKKVVLVSPSGDIVTIIGISKFCRENDISENSIRSVLKGTRLEYRGWKKYTFEK